MFAMRTQYPEGLHRPEKGSEHNWHVWCQTGAVEVLRTREYAEYLSRHPGNAYTINVGNGGYLRIKHGDELWVLMTTIAKSFKVEVFVGSMSGKYVPWEDGSADTLPFDGIKISLKPTVAQAT